MSGDKIKVMENEPKNNVEALWDTAGDFIDVRINLFKLQAIKKGTDFVSSIAAKMVLLLILIMFISILNIGIALVLGEWLGKPYYGFFVLAGFYLIAGLIFFAFMGKWIKENVANFIIKKAFK